jgi:hypothetical protein
MQNIQIPIPPAEVLLGLAPEEIAPMLLKFAASQRQNNIFEGNTVIEAAIGRAKTTHQGAYPEREVKTALHEAWQWLLVNSLIMPAEGANGAHGFRVLTRRGAALAGEQMDFKSFREAAAFPKSLLHPAIADKVWLALARGDLDDAIFAAFKAVEESVRKAGVLRILT